MFTQSNISVTALPGKAAKTTVVGTIVLTDDNNGLRFSWKWSEAKDYAMGLVDHMGLAYIKLDLRAMKSIRPERKDVAVAILKSFIDVGIKASDGRTYYVSGSTQSTKTGVLYAYATKGYWRDNGFKGIKNTVRGGAYHAPAWGSVYDMSFNLVIAEEGKDIIINGRTLDLADGQMVATPDMLTMLGSTGASVQVRAHYANAQLKGMVKAQAIPGVANTVYVRREDMKGDGAKVVVSNPISTKVAVLAHTKAGWMDIGHQTASFWPLSVWRAYKQERKREARRLNELGNNVHKFAVFASDPLRDEDGQVNRLGLLGRIAKFAMQVGNPDLLDTPGINKLIVETLGAMYIRAALGNVRSRYLRLLAHKAVEKGTVWVNPKDMPKSAAKHLSANGGMVRVVRMPDTNGGKAVRVCACYAVPKGEVWCQEGEFGVLGADHDGDAVGIIFPDGRAHVDEIIALANPADVDGKNRKEGAVPDTLEEAIYLNLQMSVGWPFDLIQRLIVLEHKVKDSEVNEAQASVLGQIATHLDFCADQGQLGVDNAKRFGTHDTDGLTEVGKFCEDMGLEESDMMWLHFSRGMIRPWMPISESVQRLPKMEEYTKPDGKLAKRMVLDTDGNAILDNGERWYERWADKGVILPQDRSTIMLPHEYCTDVSPLSRSFKWFSENLVVPQLRVIPGAAFCDRVVDGEGNGAELANTRTREWNAEFGRIAGIPDAEAAKDALTEVYAALNKFRVSMETKHPDAVEHFARRLWHIQMGGQGKQNLLWFGFPEWTLSVLEADKALWTNKPNLGTWQGQVFGGDAPEGAYTGTLSEFTGKDGQTRQMVVVTAGEAKFELVSSGANCKINRTGEFQCIVRRHNNARNLIIPGEATTTQAHNELKISVLAQRAGCEMKKDGNAWVFAGFRWEEGKFTCKMNNKPFPVQECYVRQALTHKLSENRVVSYFEKVAQQLERKSYSSYDEIDAMLYGNDTNVTFLEDFG